LAGDAAKQMLRKPTQGQNTQNVKSNKCERMEQYVQSANELDGHRVASRTFKEQKNRREVIYGLAKVACPDSMTQSSRPK
jgi:hypothetical protein